jgi:hypothetical protein
MSRMGCVNLVRMSEMLAPYNTDSRVGKINTDIVGLYAEGMYLDEYHVKIQLNTGVAGTKNWLVNGMRRAMMYRMGNASLNGYAGSCIRVIQNAASAMWKK